MIINSLLMIAFGFLRVYTVGIIFIIYRLYLAMEFRPYCFTCPRQIVVLASVLIFTLVFEHSICHFKRYCVFHYVTKFRKPLFPTSYEVIDKCL